MLTAITVNTPFYKNRVKRFFAGILGNRVAIELSSARGVALRHIIYENRTGKIDWVRLNNLVDSERNEILCADTLYLPGEIGFRRFENVEFKRRLACNLGVYLLSQLRDKNLSLGFFDVDGDCAEFVREFVKYTDKLIVVTSHPEEYDDEIEFAAEEFGAAVEVSTSRSRLENCSLIIAPKSISEILPLSGSSVVLTTAAPEVCIPGLVYYDYSFRMPNMFDMIKPSELSVEYFAGALYTLAHQRELGSIVPTMCSSFTSSQTCASLCDYLGRTAEYAQNS